MSVTVELLMVGDKDIAELVRKPEKWAEFLEKNWSGAESSKAADRRRSVGVRNIPTEVAAVLQGARSTECLPPGFLAIGKRVLANVVETHALEVGDEVVRWNEYDNDLFGYGPPSAFISQEVLQIREALEPVDDAWVQMAFDPAELVSNAERENLTASDLEERVKACQQAVRELRLFIVRAAASKVGLVQFHW